MKAQLQFAIYFLAFETFYCQGKLLNLGIKELGQLQRTPVLILGFGKLAARPP